MWDTNNTKIKTVTRVTNTGAEQKSQEMQNRKDKVSKKIMKIENEPSNVITFSFKDLLILPLCCFTGGKQ